MIYNYTTTSNNDNKSNRNSKYDCNDAMVQWCITPGLRYKIPVFSDPAPGKS